MPAFSLNTHVIWSENQFPTATPPAPPAATTEREAANRACYAAQGPRMISFLTDVHEQKAHGAADPTEDWAYLLQPTT